MESQVFTYVQSAYAALTLGNTLLAVLLYIATQFAYQAIYYNYFHPLAAFPGPFWAGATRLWIAYHDLKGQEHLACEELGRRYGKAFP